MKHFHREQSQAYSFLSMLYITLMLAANIVIYKLTSLDTMIMTVGSFIIPFTQVIIDVVAEVYGYQMAKKMVIAGLVCQFIFMFVCVALIMLPSPHGWDLQPAYNQVLGKLPRVTFGSLLGTLIGSLVNAFIISKWKIFVHGRYFWFRSLSCSMVGMLIFTSVTLGYDMFHVLPVGKIIEAIAISYFIKVIFIPVAATPAYIVANYLKKHENVPDFLHEFGDNPFKIPTKSSGEK